MLLATDKKNVVRAIGSQVTEVLPTTTSYLVQLRVFRQLCCCAVSKDLRLRDLRLLEDYTMHVLRLREVLYL